MLQAHPDHYVYVGIPSFCQNYIDEVIDFMRARNLFQTNYKYGTLYYLKPFLYKEQFNRKIMLQQAMGIVNLNHLWFNITLNIQQDKYHDKKDDLEYIEYLTGGYIHDSSFG